MKTYLLEVSYSAFVQIFDDFVFFFDFGHYFYLSLSFSFFFSAGRL